VRGVSVPASTADAVLVLSELVTNAVTHGAGATTITITGDRQRVRIEVVDDTPAGPQPRSPGNVRAGGFGLHIVTAISSSWGWDPTSRGKVVWADVPRTSDDD
jgi:anti-sigma regulatory factor (Ser/Thr protein kinase)